MCVDALFGVEIAQVSLDYVSVISTIYGFSCTISCSDLRISMEGRFSGSAAGRS